jgi:plasmid stabilization system protein ParE
MRVIVTPLAARDYAGCADLRRVVCGPYLIYAVRNNTIAVARILHGARDIETILHPHRITDPDG